MKKKNRYDQILEAAKSALRGIEKCGGDLERFLEGEGLHLQHVDFLPSDVEAALYHDIIIVRKGEDPFREKLFVLHELGHFYLHSLCIGYYQSDLISVVKFEKEAETFASLILFPTIDAFETEKDFMMQSKLPPKTAKLRINFFRKTGI